MKTNDPTTEESKEHPPVPALPDTDITTAEEETASDAKGKPVPNSKPRPAPVNPDDTYIYKDYAQTPLESLDTSTCHKKVPPPCLQAQKLPSKLAVMLTDPDLVHVVNWLPHGRSWKIVNRDQFTEIALPRYFGHKNYASFVRIVNAWGFRRVTSGIDRDSYYHELFLRGKPELHQRMKRLPSTHKKTPINKEEKSPDFYQLSKVSPLPEVTASQPAPSSNGPVHATGETRDAKDEQLENLRLSNELLRAQLAELQARTAGVPATPADAELRYNQQLMQLQKEKFDQVNSEKEV